MPLQLRQRDPEKVGAVRQKEQRRGPQRELELQKLVRPLERPLDAKELLRHRRVQPVHQLHKLQLPRDEVRPRRQPRPGVEQQPLPLRQRVRALVERPRVAKRPQGPPRLEDRRQRKPRPHLQLFGEGPLQEAARLRLRSPQQPQQVPLPAREHKLAPFAWLPAPRPPQRDVLLQLFPLLGHGPVRGPLDPWVVGVGLARPPLELFTLVALLLPPPPVLEPMLGPLLQVVAQRRRHAPLERPELVVVRVRELLLLLEVFLAPGGQARGHRARVGHLTVLLLLRLLPRLGVVEQLLHHLPAHRLLTGRRPAQLVDLHPELGVLPRLLLRLVVVGHPLPVLPKRLVEAHLVVEKLLPRLGPMADTARPATEEGRPLPPHVPGARRLLLRGPPLPLPMRLLRLLPPA